MPSTTPHIFSNDTSATTFRRTVRRQVAHRAEYAIPGSGASAQEVQRAYFAYLHCQRQQHTTHDNTAEQEAPPPAYEEIDGDEEVVPEYSAAEGRGAEDQSPSARLEELLFGGVGVGVLPPTYEESTRSPLYHHQVAGSASPPPPPPQSPPQSRLSPQTINAIFANCTIRTPKKQLHNKSIQALVLTPQGDVSRFSTTATKPKTKPKTKQGVWKRVFGYKTC